MRIAVISDIHGNLFALEKAFSFIEKAKINGIIWCGDYITDILLASEVLEFIRVKSEKYKSWIIKGNREDYIINYHLKKCDFREFDATGSLFCTYKSLSDSDIKFISSLPNDLVVDIPGCPKIYVSHKLNKACDYDYHVFGHVHKQCLFFKDGISFINPGSVGLTWSDNPGLEFALLELVDGSWCTHFYHMSYNMEYVIKYIRNSELSRCKHHWSDILIRALISGHDYVDDYIETAKSIAIKSGVPVSDVSDIPDKVWNYVYDNLEVVKKVTR